MNLEKLSVDLRVPNYRKLCALLEEPVEAGNSKEAQLRKWSQFFTYRRDKNAYIITEVYTTPKPADDQRMKYAHNLIPLLCQHLAWFGTREQSFSSWYVALGMVDEWIYNEEKREEVRFFSGLTPFQMQKLVYMTDSLCKRTLINTLRSLHKNQVITYSVNEHIVVNGVSHVATAEEANQLQRCKDLAMAAVNAKSMYAVHVNPARMIQFYGKLSEICQEEYGWDKVYTLLEIQPLNEDEISKYKDIVQKAMMEELSRSVKSSVIAQLREECNQAEQKSLEEWENDEVQGGFKLDRMTAEVLVHVLENEL